MWGELLGSVAGGVMGLYGANQTNAAASDMANKQMAFQSSMSGTAHQREVADLQKAGLNPILSANAGASTPQGAQAPVENAMGAGLQSAQDALSLAQSIKSTNSQVMLQAAQGQAATAQAQKDVTTAKESATRTQALESQLKAIGLEAKTTEQQQEWNQRMMKFDNIMKRVQGGLGAANSAKDLLNPLKGLLSPGVKKGQGMLKDGSIFDLGTGEIR